MHNIREKQKATALSCSLFLTALDRFSAFWVFLLLRFKWGFIQQMRCLSITQTSLLTFYHAIKNCSAHFPSTRNNQIDAATNQSKQVHWQTKFWPRWAWGRLCGGDPENDFKWYIIYFFFISHIIIYLLVFSGQDVCYLWINFFAFAWYLWGL